MTGLETIENFKEEQLNISVETPQNEVAGPIFFEADKAVSKFESEDEQPIEHVYSLAVQAKDYYEKGNFDAAYEVYWQILQMNVYDTNVLFESYKNLGNIFLRDADFDEAEELFNKACTIRPDSDALLVNFGVLEIQRKDLDSARERFRKALEINPKNDGAWVGLALVHRECGDIDLAWANLERALDENRSNQTALTVAMDWGIRDHRLDKAAERIRTFITDIADTKEMRLSLAKVLFCSGNYVDAKREAEIVLQRDVNDTDALKLVQIIDREVLNGK
jgi:Tfp pilus assembly protein PilF